MCGFADVLMCGCADACPERSEWVPMCPDSYRDADVRMRALSEENGCQCGLCFNFGCR
jgi:hypothetical protein